MELNPLTELKNCCCTIPKIHIPESKPKVIKRFSLTEIALLVTALVAWWIVYQSLPHFAGYMTFSVFGLQQGSHLADAVEFFIYDTPKVLMLLTIIVFTVGIINTFFTPARIRRILAGKRES